MTASSTHPGAPLKVGRAATATAGAIALSAAVAGAMLVSAITGTASTEAPASGSDVVVSSPGHPTGPTITTNRDEERRGGRSNPLHAD